MTAMEKAVWGRLRREQLGVKFRRQYPVEPYYVLDFYCPSLKICVEIDGPRHEELRDEQRDNYMLEEGILTLRFQTDEVYEDLDSVVERIRLVCEGLLK